ncbi:MAG TPA: crotonase/enoyl-CoA hydratase family protein [Alphaproteobacteria bacterium]|nr:crotonase/enoyl-CoA hydratase family protein [Alphaproteobacteria bacterium]
MTMPLTCFKVETANKIAHVQLSRPEAFNAMNRAFWNELPEIINEISDKGAARVIVISSTGKHFCAGMDLSVFTDGQGSAAPPQNAEHGRARANMRDHVKHLQDAFSCMDRARMPVLMAIQGGCVGGAVDMSTCADMRYATKDAFFVIQEINLAMTADVGTFPRLCHLLPQGMLRELAYTGRRLMAHRAYELGLVNALYDSQEEMHKDVLATAAEIAAKSPLAVLGSKVMINYARDHSIQDGLDYIATWQAGMYNPGVDMMESFKAKAEKREAVYADLLPLRKVM